jgi:hypothetical protein
MTILIQLCRGLALRPPSRRRVLQAPLADRFKLWFGVRRRDAGVIRKQSVLPYRPPSQTCGVMVQRTET